MLTRFCSLTVALAIAVVGFQFPGPAPAQEVDGPVIVVAASYPGADAVVVADTVTLLEFQLNWVEGMHRIESTSGNDGKYTARLYFQPKTDLESAMKLVRSRVALSRNRSCLTWFAGAFL